MARREALKLNIGCGPNIVPDWENINNSSGILIQKILPLRILVNITERITGRHLYVRIPKSVRKCDAAGLLPYKSETVEVIYSSHMIEHLFRCQVELSLREAFRVLKRGGVLRLVVPDLERKARAYLARLEKVRAGLLDICPADEFLRSTLLGCEQKPSGLAIARIYRAFFTDEGHHWMWDAPSLMTVVRQIGFREVRERAFLQSSIPEVQYLDLDSRRTESIYIEAYK